MELRHLRYFVTVAEEGSFVKAGRRLSVAQPALSKQIQALEREVGVPLFERVPRGVRLTRAGSAFLAEARNTLENAARAVASAQALSEISQPNVRFAYDRNAHHSTTVAELLAAHRTAHPETKVTVFRVEESKALRALREHRADVASVFSMTLPIPGFGTRVLADCPMQGVILPASHPAAAQEKISLSELRSSPWYHLTPRASPDNFQIVRNALMQRGLIPEEHHSRPDNLGAAAVHLIADHGWMLATPWMSQGFAKEVPGVVYRPFVEPAIPLWITLLWRLDDTRPEVVQLFNTPLPFSPTP